MQKQLIHKGILGMSLALLLASCGNLAAQPEASFTAETESSSSGFEVKGNISAIDTTNNTITIGAVTAWVNSSTKIEKNDVYVSLGSLTVGEQAELKYNPSNPNGASQPYASKIEVENGSSSGLLEVKGSITALNTGALTLSVGSINLWADGSTLVELNDTPSTFANLQLGQLVEVKYNPAQLDGSSNAYAARIELESGAGDYNELKGQVTAVDTVNLTLTVGTRTFWADGSTYVERNDVLATFASIAVGNWLEVKYDESNLDGSGNAYASKIEIKSGTSSGRSKDYSGQIALFDNTSRSFGLGKNTVIVTAKTAYKFKNATISSSTFWNSNRNGRKVQVKGSLSGTVITVSSVKYE